MPKQMECEICKVKIPKDYKNKICLPCYKKDEVERKQREIDEELDRVSVRKKLAVEEIRIPQRQPESATIPVNGISDPEYKENPEQADKPQWMANMVQFQKSGNLLYGPTKSMYEYIKTYIMRNTLEHPQYPKFKWRPTIVDVGCGSGVGTNILSQEADFAWGIDKNEASINFANQAFKRDRNGIYYTPQVSFDNIDITKDTREFMKFDYVVAIEIIEHIDDYKTFLKQIIQFNKRDRKGNYITVPFPTEYFISTPNRNNRRISDAGPKNKYHVREFTQEEFISVLSEYFENIEILDSLGRPVGEKKDHTPILARVSMPKI